jgi:hypothetical protein
MLPVVRTVEYSCAVFYAQGGERVQIPKGRAYVFFLYQAYHLLKKKSNLLKCQHVDIFQICHVFPPTKKHNRQADRQIADLVSGTL